MRKRLELNLKSYSLSNGDFLEYILKESLLFKEIKKENLSFLIGSCLKL